MKYRKLGLGYSFLIHLCCSVMQSRTERRDELPAVVCLQQLRRRATKEERCIVSVTVVTQSSLRCSFFSGRRRSQKSSSCAALKVTSARRRSREDNDDGASGLSPGCREARAAGRQWVVSTAAAGVAPRC